MQKWNKVSRVLLLLALLIGMVGGFFAPEFMLGNVNAAPVQAADELNVVISEFRFRGPGGPDDEFVEIYNASGATVPLINWSLKKSSGCGVTSTDLVSSINISLAPGQYYLFAKFNTYSGVIPADTSYTAAGVADDGGIALIDGTNIVDQAGLCSTTFYKEGTALASLGNSVDQSYERKAGGNAGNCKDTDNNLTDFVLNSSSSDPQNSSSSLLPCIVVTDVSSTTSDGTYADTSGTNIDIQVQFSTSVNVTGSPTLLLETGTTDRTATYISGSGTDTLTFRYTIMPSDTTGHLDYVSANALSLNGGTIIGALGDATLILPKPGQADSLSSNKDIRIDIAGNPSVLSFTRQTPSSNPTNANTLTFRVTFSEGVRNIDTSDFDAVNTSGAPTILTLISSNVYDVTISNGDLATCNCEVSLVFNTTPPPNITDAAGNPLPSATPPINESYTVDHNPPTITISIASGQSAMAGTTPVNFAVVFSDAIDVSTFTVLDITQGGSALGVTWNIVDSGDHINFTLSAIISGNGTLTPSIAINRVADKAGNYNTLASAGVATVILMDNTPPTVTINQAASQLDPTGIFPINFTVIFSEAINTSVFTTSDITQNGAATGVTWSIVNSGDNKTFTISATAASGFGTIIPFISANRVIDGAGNNNTASTSTDNTVNYVLISNAVRSVIINEIAWAGTTSGLSDDEWIELYNPGSASINISGWKIKATDGEPDILIPNGKTISAGGYYLLERDNDNTVSDIAADQIYSGALSNSGEALTLYDPTNKVIDTANGNGGAWPAGSSSTFGTMERISGTTDSDSVWSTNTGAKKNGKNADGGDILGTPKTSNTPGATPASTAVPTLIPTATPVPPPIVIDPRPIINEILARPGFDWNQDGRADVFDEFIEIKNLTAIDINLEGWVLDDGEKTGSSPFTIPDTVLKPGQRIVFYALQTNILLSDGGDTVRLINANEKIYDAYTYSIAKVEDQSICRLPDGNITGSWFEDCIPTPNLTNTREGIVPSMPQEGYESPVCDLPDTIPSDFFIAECRGSGANVWNSFYWDESGWLGEQTIPQNMSKWEALIK